MSRPDAKEILRRAASTKRLIKSTFGSGVGRDLLKELKHIYCDGKIYCDNERDTCYFLGQRDLILELEATVNEAISDEIPNGEETS